MPRLIQITLYGGDEDSYARVTGHAEAFGAVCENLRRVREAGLPLGITVTPNRYLGDGVFDTIRLAKSFCRGILINSNLIPPRTETDRSGQQDDPDLDDYVRIYRFERELDGRSTAEIPESRLPPIGGPHHECAECGLLCSGGRSSFMIDWKGTMRPCNRMEAIEALPLEEGFRAAWRRINRAACDWPRVPECEGCAYEPACVNCAAQMMRFTSPGKQPVAFCEQTRYLVQHGAWRIPDCE